MGLDMHLTAKRFMWNRETKLKKAIKGVINIKEFSPQEIEFEFIYWRKANAIHRWFVDNVQDGEDDCGDYEVSIESLKRLLNTVNTIIKDNALAEELLPTREGFFFGGTGYDEWYFNALKETKKKLDWLMKNQKKVEDFYFSYHSSW